MAVASKTGDKVFKVFTVGLGISTIYLTYNFSINVFRGISWHKAQSKNKKAVPT